MNIHPNASFSFLLASACLKKRAELRTTIERGVIRGLDISVDRAAFFALDDVEKNIVYPPESSSYTEAVAALVPQWPTSLPPLPDWFLNPVIESSSNVVIVMSPTAQEDEQRAQVQIAENEAAKAAEQEQVNDA